MNHPDSQDREKRRNSMKSVKRLAAVGIFCALACGVLHAQSVYLTATVPFDFNVGQSLLPAGEYEIYGHGPVVTVRRSHNGKASVFAMTIGASGGDPNRDGWLEFHCYGDAYFLASVWNPFSGDGRELPQTRHEKEVAKRLGAPVDTTVIASQKAPNKPATP
jgi:hypothetical protein